MKVIFAVIAIKNIVYKEIWKRRRENVSREGNLNSVITIVIVF